MRTAFVLILLSCIYAIVSAEILHLLSPEEIQGKQIVTDQTNLALGSQLNDKIKKYLGDQYEVDEKQLEITLSLLELNELQKLYLQLFEKNSAVRDPLLELQKSVASSRFSNVAKTDSLDFRSVFTMIMATTVTSEAFRNAPHVPKRFVNLASLLVSVMPFNQAFVCFSTILKQSFISRYDRGKKDYVRDLLLVLENNFAEEMQMIDDNNVPVAQIIDEAWLSVTFTDAANSENVKFMTMMLGKMLEHQFSRDIIQQIGVAIFIGIKHRISKYARIVKEDPGMKSLRITHLLINGWGTEFKSSSERQFDKLMESASQAITEAKSSARYLPSEIGLTAREMDQGISSLSQYGEDLLKLCKDRFPTVFAKNEQDMKQLMINAHLLPRLVRLKPASKHAYLEMEKDFNRNKFQEMNEVGSVSFRAAATLLFSMIPFQIPYAQSYAHIAGYLLKIMPFRQAYVVYKTLIESEFMIVYATDAKMSQLLIAKIDNIMTRVFPVAWKRLTSWIVPEYLAPMFQSLFTATIPESDLEMHHEALSTFLEKGANSWGIALMSIGQFASLNKVLDIAKSRDEDRILQVFLRDWPRVFRSHGLKLGDAADEAESMLKQHNITSINS